VDFDQKRYLLEREFQGGCDSVGRISVAVQAQDLRSPRDVEAVPVCGRQRGELRLELEFREFGCLAVDGFLKGVGDYLEFFPTRPEMLFGRRGQFAGAAPGEQTCDQRGYPHEDRTG
jgi:hypothetical protein